MRSYTPHIRDPRTPLQLEQRSRFTAMIRFAQQSLQAIRLGYKHLGEQLQITEGNCFTKRNTDLFRMENGDLLVDYQQIKLSEGTLAPVDFRHPVSDSDGVLSVAYDPLLEMKRTSPNDKVYLYAYCPAECEGRLFDAVNRADSESTIILPITWRGAEVHLYGFCIGKHGEASTTQYIGNITAYEATRCVAIPMATAAVQSENNRQLSTTSHLADKSAKATTQLSLWDIFNESVVAVDEQHTHETPPLIE